MRDLNKFRSCLSQSQEEKTNGQAGITSRLTSLKLAVEELKEKTWKLDLNTRTNLIFYGIKEDGSCCNAEFAVKEVRQAPGEILTVIRLINGFQWFLLLNQSNSLYSLSQYSTTYIKVQNVSKL